MAPTPLGIQVLMSCGFRSSWSCSSQSTPGAVNSSVKWYLIVLRKLSAGFGGSVLEIEKGGRQMVNYEMPRVSE